MAQEVEGAARRLSSRYAIVPIAIDHKGGKRPTGKWKDLQAGEIAYGLEGANALAIIGEGVIGIDLDIRTEAYQKATRWAIRELGSSVYVEESRRGTHIVMSGLDCAYPASMPDCKIDLIPADNRLLIVYPSQGYTHVHGDLLGIHEDPAPASERDRVVRGILGVVLTEMATLEINLSFEDILTPHGWTIAGTDSNGWTLVKHPNTDNDHSGAFTDEVLTVYSTSTDFAPNTGYSKWAVYAILNHGGDFGKAKQALIRLGHAKADDGKEQQQDNPLGAAPINRWSKERSKFLWKPYLPKGQIALLDAAGSSLKTTTVLSIAAHGGRGLSITGDAITPFKTMFIGIEDSPGIYRGIYEDICGGNPDHLVMIDRRFSVTPETCRHLKKAIRQNRVGLCVFDPLRSFLSGETKMDIVDALELLREVAEETGCCILNIRHVSKAGSVGRGRGGSLVTATDLAIMGEGFNAWQDSHRSQMVIQVYENTENEKRVLLQQTKSPPDTPAGSAFSLSRTETGLEVDIKPDLEDIAELIPIVGFPSPPPSGAPMTPKRLQKALQEIDGDGSGLDMMHGDELRSRLFRYGKYDKDSLSGALASLGYKWYEEHGRWMIIRAGQTQWQPSFD